jgi:hypothetical protein
MKVRMCGIIMSIKYIRLIPKKIKYFKDEEALKIILLYKKYLLFIVAGTEIITFA